ncbi:MAG: hypothetical protein U0M06_08885, partial [Clostridia bacterium]|nr:hypothetical protein [Clostridia bacterium]
MKIAKITKITILFAILIISSSIFCSCATEPPLLEDVKDEYISLIEASGEINEILFGTGLPVYKRDGREEEKQVYSNVAESLKSYEMVKDDCKYLTIDSLKAAADKVYTEDYLSPVYVMVFDGYADDDMGVSRAKFLEWDGWLYQNTEYECYIEGKRTFDYDSMKMVKPSTGEYVNIEIMSELEGEKMKITLAFSKTDDGWRLDTPTY